MEIACVLYCVHSDVRWNKGTILRASVEYIKRMQKDVQRTREVENNFKRMEMANKQLMLRIQVSHPHTHTHTEKHNHSKYIETDDVALCPLSTGVGDAGSTAWPAQQLPLWPESN